MKYIGRTGELLEARNISQIDSELFSKTDESLLYWFWFEEDGSHFTIDTQEYHFKKGQIICLTWFNKVKVHHFSSAKYIKFSKPFYCILDHDSEVGCKGILFYGSSVLPVINPDEKDKRILDTVWDMLQIEMESKDRLQLEMLQMMLKRILILCTRIFKGQENYAAIDNKQIDIVREYNYLVETHFRTQHTVSEYASMLNKSPKTLSNLFGKLNNKSPLQLIQNRIMLEARRLLSYSDKQISEIAFEIGFKDVQSFSRFFKKNEKQSPSVFRNEINTI